MTAVILAAGISSRLRPLTDKLPKSLLTVGGTPLLQRALLALQSAGISRCVIVTGYHEGLIRNFVDSLALPLQVTFVFNPHFATTNNNYSLWSAKHEVHGQDVLLLDGDILFDPQVLEPLLQTSHGDALLMRRTDRLGAEEIKLLLDPFGFVKRIGKEIDPREAVGESVGIEKFAASTATKLFETLERRRDRNEFYEASFQEIITAGTTIYAVEGGAAVCMEIDTFEDLEAAEQLTRTARR
jgi:choline kinase